MRIIRCLSVGLGVGFLAIQFQNCSPVNFSSQEVDLSSTKSSIPLEPLIEVPPICRELDADEVKPKLKWDWYAQLDKDNAANLADFSQVMSTPMVADLNGDGIPEVVFTSFTRNSKLWFVEPAAVSLTAGHGINGVLRIVNGANGANLVNISSRDLAPYSSVSPLLVDLNNDGKIEIVYPHFEKGKVIALNHDGSKRWEHKTITNFSVSTGLSAADLNGDGIPEIILPNEVIHEGATGLPEQFITLVDSAKAVKQFAYGLNFKKPNEIQIIGANGAYNAKGEKLFSLNRYLTYAAADIDSDVEGVEIVGSGGGLIEITNGLTGQLIAKIDLVPLNELTCNGEVGGGPPTIGDFDGIKETVEIAVATGRYLMIFNRKGEIISKYETQDCSSRFTGISSFDFNGDGKPEILYGDEEYFRIFEMHDGQLRVVHSIVNPSGTLNEYPVVVDVDGNKSSEILIASNNYNAKNLYKDPGEADDKVIAMSVTGVRAFESMAANSWMPTRMIWNQFDYNPQMISDRGQATKHAAIEDSYLSRTFRRNSQLGLFEPKCVLE